MENKLINKIFDKNKIIFYIAFFVSIFLTYSYIDFESNMSIGVGHAYLAKSLALSRNFNVDEYWGNAGVDVIQVGDHWYMAYAQLNGILMAIPYFGLQVFNFIYTKLFGNMNGDVSILLESLFLSLPSTIAFVGIGLIVSKLLHQYEIKKRYILLVLINLFFGTILLNYSVSFFNHVISAFFIVCAFYFLNRDYYNKKNYLYSGIFIGLSFLNEFPTILFSISVTILLIYLFREKLKLSEVIKLGTYFAIPIVIAISLQLLYQYIHFGDPFLFAEKILHTYRVNNDIPAGALDQNPIYGLWGLYLSPIKGLFLISPALLFAFFGVPKFWKMNKQGSLIISSYVIIISIFYALWSDCFGATPFGPRYLITVIPFLAFLSAFALNSKTYFLYILTTIYGIFICFTNVLDGLPSGKYFGECQIYKYASFLKAKEYLMFLKTKLRFAPIILDYISNR